MLYYLTSELSHITMYCHVILKKFYLCKSVSTYIADMLFFVLCVMSLHMQSKIFLSVKLFATFITGVVKI